ncbi:MAG: SRPBCC family protein [Actinobacteria bacterium]|nr:SRPBCC family protein [Actinomycetota bacterium]
MVTVEKSIMVRVPVDIAYAAWANLQNFPIYAPHVVRSVEMLNKGRSRWIVDLLGYELQFEAELDEDRPNRLISWHSVSNVKHFGSAYFSPVTGGTVVTIRLMFDTGGLSSEFVDDLDVVWHEFEEIFKDTLHGFKKYVEQMWWQVPIVI